MEIDEVHHLPNTAMIKPKKQANKETVHLCSELRTQKENHIPPFSQKGKPLRLRLQNYPGTPSPPPLPRAFPHSAWDPQSVTPPLRRPSIPRLSNHGPYVSQTGRRSGRA